MSPWTSILGNEPLLPMSKASMMLCMALWDSRRSSWALREVLEVGKLAAVLLTGDKLRSTPAAYSDMGHNMSGVGAETFESMSVLAYLRRLPLPHAAESACVPCLAMACIAAHDPIVTGLPSCAALSLGPASSAVPQPSASYKTSFSVTTRCCCACADIDKPAVCTCIL